MPFTKALEQLQQGKKVVRQSWTSGEQYIIEITDARYQGEAVNPYFLIKTDETPAFSVFQPTSCDILADDWQLVS
ncbi:MAG: DUF2829 domain-containing protein [Lactobacillus sp.]|uniref:DUF2829 domain-containing protein n=1 Tax=Bombilactobacillus bombi TaxID=1303590 RepID=UPI0035E5347D|nr:DUF2829 domain-containing protein [Lactobacillus sp.]